MMAQEGHRRAAREEIPLYAIRTWRYLRVAMILLVLGLAMSVAWETTRSGCLRTSISAYWYSPARGFFVAALVAIGVCLVCLQGTRELENVLLNVAGMLAPLVAFVPTTETGGCKTTVAARQGVLEGIANNVPALLALGGAALLITLVLAVREGLPLLSVLAGELTAIAWAGVLWAFEMKRGFFSEHAHLYAAGVMFLCLAAVAGINAWLYSEEPGKSLRSTYSAVAAGMVAGVGFFPVGHSLLHWSYTTLFCEIVLLTLFVAFWIRQTSHLWCTGLWLRAESS